MQSAGDLLKNIFDKICPDKLQNLKAADKIFRNWDKIVGDPLCAHSKVVEIEKNSIIIEVDHPGWMQMLRFKDKAILIKLKQHFPELKIRSLRIKTGEAPDTTVDR